MTLKFPVQPLAYADLFRNANAPNASTPEAVPFVWYDSQDLASSWTSVDFFTSPQSDKTLSNIEQPNTLSSEQYFQLYAITLDFLMGASQNTNAAAQQYDDARIIQDTGRAIFELFIAQKLYLRVPARCLHSAGGVWAVVQGVPAAAALFNTVQNFPADGAFWIDGAIILPPKQTFQITLRAVAAALTATRKVQIALHGVLFRPVR